MPRIPSVYTVTVDKLVHGGQSLGVLENGKIAFVWGALPGEKVRFTATKKRKDFVEGIADEILIASSERIEPRDDEYMSTSPWQILSENIEDKSKLEILKETFKRSGLDQELKYISVPTKVFYGYRNKMEYSFYGDEKGLHLALFNRGTHQKRIVQGSSIARSEINDAAITIRKILEKNGIRASDLKTLVLRSDQQSNVAAALYVKDPGFPKIDELGSVCKGLSVLFSNPKSPASVRTKDLYTFGDVALSDTLLDKVIRYDVYSFFQVNVPVYEQVLRSIKNSVSNQLVVDMYSGVGSIGLVVSPEATLIESDNKNIVWARKNSLNTKSTVVESLSENASDHITNDKILIVDPPRAGLHANLTQKIISVCPPEILYLSCNPSTQSRDLKLLQEKYKIKKVECYNFFPRTPHIESLAFLVRR